MHSVHFSDAELACHNCGFNGCQPVLVDSMESVRVAEDVPIIVDDAFRCPLPPPGVAPYPGHCGHNAAAGGVPHSQHELGMAADIKIQGMTPAEMYKAALKVPAFANGGIGVTLGPTGYIH